MKRMKHGRKKSCVSTKARATERDVVLCVHGVTSLRLGSSGNDEETEGKYNTAEKARKDNR